jgi:hypothetical protein
MAKLRRAAEFGEFNLSGLVVTAKLTEDQTLKFHGTNAVPFVINGAHRSYRLPNASLGDRTFLPVAFFSNGAITFFQLTFPDLRKRSWADWSEGEQRAKQADHALWITQNLGVASPHTFPWGFVDSIFDPKSGSSFIYVRYRDCPLVEDA